ncbi:hypothetical protein BGZ65_006543 [Modicella reniformis]|uniref:Uncharacterized protein n=1 Tax=Modicella reniformis TaxID=1440133 RepID=A0A9P6JH95_9FUNG|nr:hypothetical protein BGZ65_006543 [Modicella reniformis]
MDPSQLNWLASSVQPQPYNGDGVFGQESLRSALGDAYPPIEPLLQDTQALAQSLYAPSDRGHVSTQTSMQDLKDVFRMVYQHLREKHYLDRFVHALYLHPDGGVGLSKLNKPAPLEEAVRNGRNAFMNKTRVIFPRPCELQAAIKKARESSQDLSLLLLTLTEPLLRFHICMIAHLMEAAFAPVEDAWDGEHPRRLTAEELTFVMDKLQDFFMDLFQLPAAQTSLRRFFTTVSGWSVQSLTTQDDENTPVPDFPDVVQEIFPCYDVIFQEYRNLLVSGKNDATFQSEARRLFKFVMLSLKELKFTSASDWTTEGRQIFDKFQKTLSNTTYRGPAQRLLRNLVSMTDQLWEGGGITDTSLAIEKCLSIVIRKSLVGSDVSLDHELDAVGSWDVMHDFERLLRAADNHITSIPLPSIIWTRENSEICLDAMVIHFPRLMTNNIQLDSKMEFDTRTGSWRRQWHLTIRGLEIEANNVPYYFVVKSPLQRHLVDIGQLSMSVPSNSLDIEAKFTLTTPRIRHRKVVGRGQAQDQPGATTTETAARRQSTGEHPTRTTRDTGQAQTQGAEANTRRGSEPTGRPTQMGRIISRSSRITHEVTEDSRSVFNVITQLLYPNRDRYRLSKTLSDPHQRPLQTEQMYNGWIPTTERVVWGRRRMRYNSEANGVRSRSRQVSTESSFEASETTNVDATDAAPYLGFAETTTHEHKKFIIVDKCSVRIRKLDIQVHATKHPLLYAFAHTILVRRIQRTMELTFLQIIADIANTINTSVEEIMEFSHEELRNRHAGPK